jgi:hypothetical protein
MLGKQLQTAAAGSAGGEKVYVDDVFSTFLYDGSGSTRDIVNGIDLDGEGGLVWIKGRDNNRNHQLFDTERGVNNTLISNSTGEAVFDAGGRKLQAFNDDGFELGSDALVNSPSGESYCSWTFRKTPGFFDIVTFTSSGASSQQIAHNLGSVPGCIIVKNLDSSSAGWYIYHRGVDSSSPENYGLEFTTAARNNNNGYWNNTAPTSTHFTLGNVYQSNTDNYVAYVFAHDDQSFGADEDEAIIKCGNYGGNGGTQAIDLGFEPQWVLVKRASGGTANWLLMDTMRGMPVATTGGLTLYPNLNIADNSAGYWKPNSTGFVLEGNSTDHNASGSEYIYIAIRRPNKPPESATDVFAMDTGNSSSTIPAYDSNFPVDFAISRIVSSAGYAPHFTSRLTGTNYLRSDNDFAQQTDADYTWDSNVGWGKSWYSQYQSWMFRRAPGFFDIVCWDGDQSNPRNISHNLGSAPEFIIVKQRDPTFSWYCYHTVIGATKAIVLNGNSTPITSTNWWNNTAPTSSVFTVQSNFNAGTPGNPYVAYLFATLDGISKVGSYTGTGNNIDVNCGFTAGARFVLIKRTDSSGDWYLFDSLRGIVGGNDPYLLLNDRAAQDTNTDYIDPLNSGFTVTSSAPAALNASGGTYMFLAIA